MNELVNKIEAHNDRQLNPVPGIRLAAVAGGIRYENKLDLVVIELAESTRFSAVFTRNAFCAAPVTLARSHLVSTTPRYLLINTGNANAGTGEKGTQDAISCCEALAKLTQSEVQEILPFSTGVIGEYLPVDKVTAGLPMALDTLTEANWWPAAQGIMTTDTCPKARSLVLDVDGTPVTITGIAKGAGMIRPDMATMLAFVFTDADIEKHMLNDLLVEVVDQSFNRITVDGDTSTNDSCVLAATGLSGVSISRQNDESFHIFKSGLSEVFQQLAQDIIRDAEGATKFITINVVNGENNSECLQVAYAIAESPLVKTAFFASDPNWGRILAVVGRAGLKELDISKVSISLGETLLVEAGGIAPSYTEVRGQFEMDKDAIVVTIDLDRGGAAETVWTSDLSHDYIRINAEYRT